MKLVDETGHYEVFPARIAFRGVPFSDLGRGDIAGGRDSLSANTFNYRGVRTLPDTISAAQRRANARIREVLRRVGHGDVTEVLDLLHENPEYINNPDIRKTVVKLASNKNRLRRRRGRIAEKYTAHPLVITGLVDECIIQRFTKNKESIQFSLRVD